MPSPSSVPDVTPLDRCFGCRNRTSVEDAVVLEGGILCCRRCAVRRQIVASPTQPTFTVEVIG